jgi:glycosyltransferase involved in cell wall biosynthesis
MRVLHIITRLDKGGSADVFLDLTSGLRKMGHDVFIAVGPTLEPQTDIDTYSQKSGIPVHHIKYLQRDCSPFTDCRAFLEILKVIKKIKPHVLHTHTSKAGFIGRIAGRLAGVNVAIHMPHGHIFYGYFSSLKTRMFILLETIAALFTYRILTLTEIEKMDYIREKIARAEKIATIPCGIDIDRYSLSHRTVRDEIGIPPGLPVIGWVGRTESVKGCEYFLRACKLIKKELPDARYLFIGEGPLKGEMEELARTLNISKEVIFAGYRTDMPEIMNSIDLLLHTPLNEGLGRVLLEAMICEKPVVAADVGGIPEIIEHGVQGFLVPAGDTAAMARESLRILKDQELSKALGSAGRERALEYSTENMVRKINTLYKESYEPIT